MTNITVGISDDRFAELKETANRLHMTPEQLIQISIDDLLSRPDDDFQRSVDYVLKKNAELYRRLA